MPLLFGATQSSAEELNENKQQYLIGTCYDRGKLVSLLLLALDHGLQDGRVVRTQVDEDIGNTSLLS